MRPAEYLDNPCPKGERNNTLFAAVMSAREDDWPESRIRSELGSKAARDGLSPAEIANTINSAMSRPLSPRRPAQNGPDEFLAWDAVITDEESSPPLPSDTKDAGFPGPVPEFEHEDFRAFLHALFRPDEIVAYNSDFQTEEDGHVRPRGRGVYVRTSADLDRACSRESTVEALNVKDAAGAWVRLNPMDGKGIADVNVVEYRHALVESDSLPVEQQWAVLERLKVPCATVVHSGGKSLHAAVRIGAGTDRAEYDRRVAKLYSILEQEGLRVDRQNRNPSRLSRMPGVTRLGRPQYLLGTNLGCASWDAWMDSLTTDEDIPLPECWRDLRRNPPSLAPEIIHGILRKGHKLLLGGPSKAGKSYALIQLAAAIAGGSPWLGHSCAKGRVLYVNLEIDRASFVQRVLWIEEHMPFAPENLSVWSLRGRVMELKTLKTKLIHWLKHQQAFDLLILDPIYKTNDGDENSARDMTAFCNSIESIATDTGAAIAFAHHFSKGQQGAKAAIDRASGSGVFGRDPDAVATLSELEGDDCAGFLLEWTLREFAAPSPVALVFQWPVHRVEKLLSDRKVKGAPGRLQKITALDVVNALGIIEGEPTVAAIAEHLDVTEKTVRNCVNRSDSLLMDRGIVRFQEAQ